MSRYGGRQRPGSFAYEVILDLDIRDPPAVRDDIGVEERVPLRVRPRVHDNVAAVIVLVRVQDAAAFGVSFTPIMKWVEEGVVE